MRDAIWKDGVHAWVCGVTGEQLGPLEHVRTEAWSTVWRVQGAKTTFWFKENTPTLTPEGPVQSVLAELAPDQVTAPVAWDGQKGWLLTPDGGQVLQDRYPERRGMDPTAIGDMLRDYVLLQRATIGQAGRLGAAGLPDRSPATAGRTLQHVANAMAAAAPDDPRCITGEELDRLERCIPAINEAGRDLHAGPVPLALDHNDLFPRNVFVPRPGQRYRFFDFGESLWSHPFESLVMLVWEVIHQHKLQVADSGPLDLDHPAIHGLITPYLDGWRDYADHPTLRRQMGAALQIAPLYRAERWMDILTHRPDALGRHGGTPRAWIFDIERHVLI